MIHLRRLNKSSSIAAPITTIIPTCYFTTVTPIAARKPAPSSANYGVLIDSAGRKGDFAAVRRLFSDRVADGHLTTTNTFKFIATNTSALDDLLHNLADLEPCFTRKHAHDDILHNLADLEPCFTRKHAHDALVAQLARLHRTDDALRVARNNHGATAITFCPIISALAKKRDMPGAWRVVEAMRACGVRPNATAFNYILTAHCCDCEVAAAADVLVEMEAEGMKGDALTYDALVLGACRAGKVEEALVVMRRAVEEGIPALFSTYRHIVKGIMDCGYYMQAMEFVRIFAGKNEKLDVELFEFVERRLKNLKIVAERELVVEEMMKRGLTIGDGS